MSQTILIGADIVPTDSNCDRFADGNINYLIGDKLIERLYKADFIAMNLEVPLVDEKNPIDKCGPCLSAPTATIKGIKAINPCFFTLANNHILDQGVVGLKSTLNVLRENNIQFSGVGDNLEQARKVYLKDINGLMLGIYCCAEHEFSVASAVVPGANPYDPLVSFDDVQNLRGKCDYLIVLYHGGKEHYRYPSPLLRRIFRKFAEVGADLVIAQHTHCIGCKEEYKGSTLIYGQGNFLFDHSQSEYWKTSLLIEVDGVTKKIMYIPLVKEDERVREAEEYDKNTILSDFYCRSEEIKQLGFVEEKYEDFADKMEAEYLLRFSGGFGKNILLRLLNKVSSYRLIKSFYPQKQKRIIQNVMECEAHRELAIQCMRKNKVDSYKFF